MLVASTIGQEQCTYLSLLYLWQGFVTLAFSLSGPTSFASCGTEFISVSKDTVLETSVDESEFPFFHLYDGPAKRKLKIKISVSVKDLRVWCMISEIFSMVLPPRNVNVYKFS